MWWEKKHDYFFFCEFLNPKQIDCFKPEFSGCYLSQFDPQYPCQNWDNQSITCDENGKITEL